MSKIFQAPMDSMSIFTCHRVMVLHAYGDRENSWVMVKALMDDLSFPSHPGPACFPPNFAATATWGKVFDNSAAVFLISTAAESHDVPWQAEYVSCLPLKK